MFYGRSVSVCADKYGNALGLTANFAKFGNVDITPKLSEKDIEKIIDKEYKNVNSIKNSGLVIYSLYDTKPQLAYSVM